MRILVALIAVFMVSGAVAQKKPTANISEEDGDIRGMAVTVCARDDAGLYQCKDPSTGKTQMVKCKNPPKQKLPPKLSMAELDQACGIILDTTPP